MRWPLGLAMMAVTSMCTTTSSEPDRVCWKDEDCNMYPPCHTRVQSCRCQPKGSCLLARGYHQRCWADSYCTVGMFCSEEGLCLCEDGYRYSKFENKCIIVPNRDELPRFADLPDEEIDAPPQIPATYGGPLLVGSIGMGLVLLCLGTALWCRCTSPRSPIGQSPPSYCTDRGGEKIPLDLLPPPEKYQTPGYHNNYQSMKGRSLASTSRACTTISVQLHNSR